jgi:hypothetical protein
MKKLPKHRSEAEERDFCAKEDSSVRIHRLESGQSGDLFQTQTLAPHHFPPSAGDDDRRAKASIQQNGCSLSDLD